MSDCEFCRIAQKGAPAAIVYQDEYTCAFLNIRPVRKGHILVIPKEHWEETRTMDDELSGKIMATMKKCENLLYNEFSPPNVEFLKSGWEVPHVHIHVLPTYQEDDITSKIALDEGVQEVPIQQLYNLAEKIKKAN